jgi:hypothetical protein
MAKIKAIGMKKLPKKPCEFEVAVGMTYGEAVAYLKKTGKYENAKNLDGFSLTAYAARLRSNEE